MTNTKISRGEVIFFSKGEYSDYSYCGEVIFTKSANLSEQAQVFRKISNPENDPYGDDLSGFVTWLVAQEFCLPLKCREVHLGGYSEFDSDFLEKEK